MSEPEHRPLGDRAVVPVVVIADAARARETARALTSGGITCAEITLRTDAALGAIAAIANLDGFLVGAGTVVSVEQVDLAVAAGARFIVSPGLDERIVDRARTLGVAVIPGVATASEAMRANALGLRHVKLFPADRIGGLATIRAFATVLPDLRFMPSGGVGPENASDYLRDPNVFAVSASWMVAAESLDRGDFTAIARRSAQASTWAAA